MKRLVARSQAEVGPLLDYVHDRSYSLEGIVHEQSTGSLTVPVSLGSAGCVGTLIVRGVLSFEIHDSAEIGDGDINSITFEPDGLTIRGALPVDLIAKGQRIIVELLLPDDAPRA